nr:hypothetical protein CFP56_33036 [Quercus suber]
MEHDPGAHSHTAGVDMLHEIIAGEGTLQQAATGTSNEDNYGPWLVISRKKSGTSSGDEMGHKSRRYHCGDSGELDREKNAKELVDINQLRYQQKHYEAPLLFHPTLEFSLHTISQKMGMGILEHCLILITRKG